MLLKTIDQEEFLNIYLEVFVFPVLLHRNYRKLSEDSFFQCDVGPHSMEKYFK